MSKPPMHALKPEPPQADHDSVPRQRGVVVQLPFKADHRPLKVHATTQALHSAPHQEHVLPEVDPVDDPAEPETHIHYIRENLRFLMDTFDQLLEPLRAVRDAGSDGLDPTRWAELQDKVRKDLSFLDSEVPTAIQESLEGMAAVAHHVEATQQRGGSSS